MAYCAFRFLVELLRLEPTWWLGLSAYQWAALAFFPPLLWQWKVDARAPQRKRAPESLAP